MARFVHGTAGWSYKDWVGPFYPEGTRQGDYLALYSRRFPGVEVDSTFYREPSRSAVRNWHDGTPSDFLISPKMVRQVTHDSFLVDCEDVAGAFMDAVSNLGKKLGPVVLQFPYFRKAEGPDLDSFLERLVPFLDSIDSSARLAVEVRNKTFLKPALFDALRDRQTALVLIDHPWMYPPDRLATMAGIFTADFLPIRLLGDRRGVEKITKTWEEVVIDRTARLESWADLTRGALARGLDVTAFVNNHFSGHAPATAALFAEMVAEL
ncbi:MAG: DUF72 domain-containing protein [Planctomycetota bacterium]|jgi:uncharacterized protein YecE (DUF72 family)